MTGKMGLWGTMVLVSCVAASWAGAADALQEGREAMRAKDFQSAAEAFSRYRADPPAEGARVDEAMYLRALALFHAGEHGQSLTGVAQLLEAHPESAWDHKARFLQAATLMHLRRFQEAERIYREETHRLLSGARKHEIAGVIVSFADALETEPDPNDLDAPPADFAKAYQLYGKALEMEIGRELRDTVLFRRARAIQRQGNHRQAIRDFEAYLSEFDPAWTGPSGAPSSADDTRGEDTARAGEHIESARYHLAEAYLGANDRVSARRIADDWIRRAPTPAGGEEAEQERRLADYRWLIVRSYNPPQPAGHELDAAIDALRRFLAGHPGDARSVVAAWHIAETYRNHGRAADAIAACRALIDGENHRLPEGEARTQVLEGYDQSPAELQEIWAREALYRIGQLRFRQNQYERAIEAWRHYVARHTDGPHWADAQSGILNARFQSGVDHISRREYEQGRERLTAFMADHPLDARSPQVLFLFGQIEYQRAEQSVADGAEEAEQRASWQRAIDAWRQLVGKYPNTEESSLALYRIGRVYEEKMGDLDRALEAYRQLTWGSHRPAAQQRIAEMTRRQLTLATERTFRTDEQPVVKLSTRNIETVTVRQYRLNMEAFFRNTHAMERIEDLDIALIQPDRTWEVEIDGYAPCLPVEQRIEIPFEDGEGGVYLVNVSTEQWEATTLVVRSDLDLIIKSSRREALVFAQDMRSGAAADGVRVLLSDGRRIIATGRTGEDGTWLAQSDDLHKAEDVRVFAWRDGSVAGNAVNVASLGLSTGLTPKGYLYTDRPAYQPGQAVSLRGVLRELVDGEYHSPVDRLFTLSVLDPEGRLIWQEDLTAGEFGTIHTRFTIDEAASVGQYALRVREANNDRAPTFSVAFQVEQFQLQQMRLTLTTPEPVYFRGEDIELTIEVAYYWDQPIAHRPVRYRLPDGRELVESTGDEGTLTITFDTTAMQPGATLEFRAEIEGENVRASHRVSLATQGFGITVEPSREVVLAGGLSM